MQNTSAQLLFHIRLDPLKLARDPLEVVAGYPMDLNIFANGSPDHDADLNYISIFLHGCQGNKFGIGFFFYIYI